MTLLPSPLRERAPLALVLAAVGISVAVSGPTATGATRPGEEHPEPPKPLLTLKREGEEKDKPKLPADPRDPAALAPAHPPPAEAAVLPPEAPQAPASSQPTVLEPDFSPRAQRRTPLSTRGATASPRPSRERSEGGTPPSPGGSVAPGRSRATGDDRFDTTNAETKPAPDDEADEDAGGGSPVTRTVEEIVEVVPESVEIAFAGLLGLSLVLAGASLLSAGRARRLARQRRELLQEVGLLQSALLPPVPEELGALRTSVAYRPAEGPGAGGDFYDALPLPDGRVAFILGDVSGHGRAALERTAFLRYTLRAYLEAGLEPRVALQVGGRVIDGHLAGDFATVVLAIHDPETASLTFACAGHPAPIVVGPSKYAPVLPGASPPLGIGLRTGLRQTTIPLAPGSVACLFTDGLTEARTERGILGRPRLGDILEELGRDAQAGALLERVATEARLVTDDMAACLISPTSGVTAGGFRTEQLELSADELGSNLARRFLDACGVEGEEAARVELEAAELARQYGSALLKVSFGTAVPSVEVVPSNVESIEASSRRSASAS